MMTSTPQPPIAYRLHGHPVCLACLDDDYLLYDDGTARGWPTRGDVPGVQPIHAGDPDATGPCAGCRRPLITPPAADARALSTLDDPDDSAPFRPDDGPTRLALAVVRLRDAAAALRRCLAHGDLDSAPQRDAFRDLAACLDAASLATAWDVLVRTVPPPTPNADTPAAQTTVRHRRGTPPCTGRVLPPASPERTTYG